VDDERFAAAIDRARKLLDATSKTQMAGRILQMLGRDSEKYATRFPARTGARIQIVLAEEVDWISAAGDYTELHVRGRSHLWRETVNPMEQKLDPTKFLRIHRSRILRTKGILELRGIDNREFLVKLSDGSGHRSSVRAAHALTASNAGCHLES
jgi:two-component system, LytTR family, response regulator